MRGDGGQHALRGPNVLEWTAKHAGMHNDWKLDGCVVLSYVLLWRPGVLVLQRPKRRDTWGMTF